MDATLATPSLASSNNLAVVRCNVASRAIGDARALGAGGIVNATFTSNSFPTTWIGKNLKSYWGKYNNRWNGSLVAPGPVPGAQTFGC